MSVSSRQAWTSTHRNNHINDGTGLVEFPVLSEPSGRMCDIRALQRKTGNSPTILGFSPLQAAAPTLLHRRDAGVLLYRGIRSSSWRAIDFSKSATAGCWGTPQAANSRIRYNGNPPHHVHSNWARFYTGFRVTRTRWRAGRVVGRYRVSITTPRLNNPEHRKISAFS